MSKAGVVFIQAPLVTGFHDALLALLQEDNRRMANHLVLTVSEACLDIWPVTIQDYKAPGDGELHDAKIALNPNRFPRLYKLYTSLPPGVKGLTMINLLNRHQMMKEASPEEANAALNRMLLGRQGLGEEANNQTHQAGDVPGPAAALGPEEKTEVNVSRPTEAAVPAKVAAPPAAQEDILDPLASMPPLSFD
ncbi:hypothetical protein EGJ28_16610 [Stutzerimonas xanthomarina]|uniref:Uncharacterized protein n=1 Tax=Stutzerimonas xanthomarina TaxID=271420 RepID=A0A427DYL5_9GAMM|nr:hypothetical protein [Stutzerimonas xanthomarina]KIL03203.1 hypothetical protein QX25_18695 [Stutzerimonas stutzeri]RRV08885.1 hypothetical protein EGJ28_16610 [Stutzerimonas xanthomarina]